MRYPHHFPRVRETRPCQVRASLTKHLNQVMVLIEESTLVRHIETKVVEVELTSVTNKLQSMELE